MSRNLKFENNDYLDSSSIVHNKEKLSDILETSNWILFNQKYNVYYKKTGKIVTLTCLTTQSITLPDFSKETIGQLPSNCKPLHNISFPIYVRGNANVFGTIDTSGEMILFNWTSSAKMEAGTIRFNVTFPID